MSFSKKDLAQLCNFLNKMSTDDPEDALDKTLDKIENTSTWIERQDFSQDQLVHFRAENNPSGK